MAWTSAAHKLLRLLFIGFTACPRGLTIACTTQGYNYAPALISVGGRKLRAMDGKAAARKLMGGMSAAGRAAVKKASDIETSQDLVFRQSYENCTPGPCRGC